VQEGMAFRFADGESIALDDNGRPIIFPDETEATFTKEVEGQGIQLGDAIAKLTKAFGIKPCSACEKRRQILNHISEIGVKAALQKLKETF